MLIVDVKINAAEIWFYRRLLRASWTVRRTNERVLRELSEKRQMLREVDKRRLKYVGHALRNTKTDLMFTVLQGKTDAKRKRGIQQTSYIANITEASRLGVHEMTRISSKRNRWCALVMSVGAPTDARGYGNR